jgi:hypothetical protein
MKTWYYVMYEDSSERKISSEKESIEECNKWIDNSKEVAKQYNKSYIYTILQTIEK